MVNRVDSNHLNSLLGTGMSNPLQQNEGAEETQATKAVDRLHQEAQEKAGVADSGAANVSISSEAKTLWKREQEALRFARLAMSQPETVDNPAERSGKIAYLQNLVDHGRTQEYLRTLNTDDLVNSMLSSPTAAFLR